MGHFSGGSRKKETTSIESDAMLKDKDDFTAVVAGTTNEVN